MRITTSNNSTAAASEIPSEENKMNTALHTHPQVSSDTKIGRMPRRGLQLIGSLLVALAMTVGLVSGASASTTSSIGVAGATSYGFNCNSGYNWVHQNWPNIWVNGSTNQYVYTRSFLYRWDGSAWVNVRTSQWYVGVSNNTGRKILGYTAGGLPYYWAIAGQPSQVPPNDGYAFTNLADGYYRTMEQYQAAGQQWLSWNNVQGSTATYCIV